MDKTKNNNIPFDNEHEKLFRAVLPKGLYWDSNQRITSRVFDLRKNERGLSLERALGRSDNEACHYLREHLQGKIISITVKDCNSISVISLHHTPTNKNPYHSELIYSRDLKMKIEQAKHILATKAIIYDY